MRRSATAWVALACLALAHSPPARAQSNDPAAAPDARTDAAAVRDAARAIGDEGIALFDRGEWAAALERFDRAESMVPVPTLALRAARCLEKMGRWMEAADRYLRATTMSVDETLAPANRQVQLQAQTDAFTERNTLLGRLPHVTLRADGPVDSVTIDERPIPVALLGQRQPLDPGPHVVRASRAGRASVQHVELAPGDDLDVELRSPAQAQAPRRPDVPPSSPAMRSLGWIAVVAGGAGVVAGAITLGVTLDRQSDLDAACDGEACGPEDDVDQADVETYNTLTKVWPAALIAGGVLSAAGVVLLVVTNPSASPKRSAGADGLTFRF